MEEKTFRKILIAIIILFSSLRLLSILMSLAYLWDEAAYIGMAQGLKNGLPYGFVQENWSDAPFRAPLLIEAVYVLTLVLGNAVIAAKVLITVVSVASIVSVYYLGRLISDRRFGLVAAAITATMPFHIFFSFKILVENFFGFLIIWSLIFLFLSEKNKKFLLAFAVTFVLAVYARYSALILLPAATIALLLFKRETLKDILKSKYFFVSLLVIGLLLVPIFNGARNQLSERRGFLYGHYLIYWMPVVGIIFPLALYGFWKCVKVNNKNLRIIAALVILILIGHEFVATRTRYIVFLLPVFSLIAAYGFVQLEKKKFSSILLIILLLVNGIIGILLVIFSTAPQMFQLTTIKDPLGFGDFSPTVYESYKDAGIMLKTASSEKDAVISDSCVFVNIYSERKCYLVVNETINYLKSTPLDKVSEVVKNENVKWVYVIGSNMEDTLRRSLSDMEWMSVYRSDYVRVYKIG